MRDLRAVAESCDHRKRSGFPCRVFAICLGCGLTVRWYPDSYPDEPGKRDVLDGNKFVNIPKKR